jgi:hypothetical protein
LPAKFIKLNLTLGRLEQDYVLVPSDTSVTAAADKIPIATASGTLDPSWGITASGGGTSTSVYDQILNTLTLNNSDPIDQKILVGDYIVLIYLTSHSANSWKSATSAVHTVTTGKKLVILQAVPIRVMNDSGARRWRLFNVTDSTDVTHASYAYLIGSSPLLAWDGDVSETTQFTEVPAGKQIRLEVWNVDTNKRAMGGYVICREIDA